MKILLRHYSMKKRKIIPLTSPIIKKTNHTAAGILKGILFSTASFGIRSLFVASHHVGDGLIMSSLGPTMRLHPVSLLLFKHLLSAPVQDL